jgi:hypothetical protein
VAPGEVVAEPVGWSAVPSGEPPHPATARTATSPAASARRRRGEDVIDDDGRTGTENLLERSRNPNPAPQPPPPPGSGRSLLEIIRRDTPMLGRRFVLHDLN